MISFSSASTALTHVCGCRRQRRHPLVSSQPPAHGMGATSRQRRRHRPTAPPRRGTDGRGGDTTPRGRSVGREGGKGARDQRAGARASRRRTKASSTEGSFVRWFVRWRSPRRGTAVEASEASEEAASQTDSPLTQRAGHTDSPLSQRASPLSPRHTRDRLPADTHTKAPPPPTHTHTHTTPRRREKRRDEVRRDAAWRAARRGGGAPRRATWSRAWRRSEGSC